MLGYRLITGDMIFNKVIVHCAFIIKLFEFLLL